MPASTLTLRGERERERERKRIPRVYRPRAPLRAPYGLGPLGYGWPLRRIEAASLPPSSASEASPMQDKVGASLDNEHRVHLLVCICIYICIYVCICIGFMMGLEGFHTKGPWLGL